MTKHCLAVLLLLAPLASPLLAASDEAKPLVFGYYAYQGDRLDIKDYSGQVVLIFFWATWSKPSRDVLPTVIKAYHKYHDKNFAILGVSCDVNDYTFKNFLNSYYMPWPEYFDGKGERNDVATTMKVKELPSLWLVGKDGVLISNTVTGATLDAQIQKALAAPDKK